MNKKYFNLVQDANSNEATINIYGDITSWEWYESDVSSFTLSKQLESLDVSKINVYINSYGGEVAEGLAIYNALKRHKAHITTYCDGFACSIASVIFMAGDERVMSNASLLMIHNAWTWAAGNANELRKQADDLDKMTQASINAYMSEVNITEEELKSLLDAESWLTPQEAFEKGFVTSIVNEKKSDKASQSAKKTLFDIVMSDKLNKAPKQQENNGSGTEGEEPHNPEVENPIEDENEEPQQNLLGSFFNAFLK